MRIIGTRRFFHAFAVRVPVEQEVFRIRITRNTGFRPPEITGGQHNVDFKRHGDIAHSADCASGIQIFHIAVRSFCEERIIVFDKFGIVIRYTRKIAFFRADTVQVALIVGENKEHIRRN